MKKLLLYAFFFYIGATSGWFTVHYIAGFIHGLIGG